MFCYCAFGGDDSLHVLSFNIKGNCRHKTLKPPGAKKPTTRVKQPVSAEAKALQAELKAERLAQQALPGEAPTLRHSTRVRVEEAQQVRQRAEKVLCRADFGCCSS